MKELPRQMIHLSGALFIILAQFMESSAASAMFFMIALMFLLYSFYIRKEENRFKKFIRLLDEKIRGTFLKYERPGIPFQGAFWFYFGCGLTFLIFPKSIATTACLILAVSDSLSTIVGFHMGKKKLLGKKTLEGTLAFFLSAALIGFFLLPQSFLAGALAATLGELAPELVPSLRKKALIDDNWIIPLLVGLAFFIFR